LLLPHGAQGGHGRERFHPVRSARSLERIEEHPAISTHLVGILVNQLKGCQPFASFTMNLSAEIRKRGN